MNKMIDLKTIKAKVHKALKGLSKEDWTDVAIASGMAYISFLIGVGMGYKDGFKDGCDHGIYAGIVYIVRKMLS